MKLHHLRLKGIGPFRDEVAIDFAALGASGVFLLEGPTGSGKSTILDAVVFALYGGVAGAGSTKERIRSQFSDPSEPSMVDLVFETGQGIYRVRRSPEYQRAKKRGSGTTKHNASAVLWRVGSPELIAAAAADGAGAGAGLTPIATRLDDVGKEITRALGLSLEQFTQTVLLPQNEFARFLRAGTADRQKVLERVFGTELYARVEQQLEDMRKASKREVDDARARLGEATARLLEASRSDAGKDSNESDDASADPGLEPASSEEVEEERREKLAQAVQRLDLPVLREAATQLTDDTATRAARAAERHEIAREAEREARERLDHARLLRERIERRRALDALAEEIRHEAPSVLQARTALAIDAAARSAASALDRRDQAAALLQQTAETLHETRDQARGDQHDDLADLIPASPAANKHHDSAGAIEALIAQSAEEVQRQQDAQDALHKAWSHTTADAGSLRDLLALEKALPAREKSLAARQAKLTERTEKLAQLQEKAAQLPVAREALATRLSAARQDAEGHGDAVVAVKNAAAAHQAAQRADALTTELAAAEERTAQLLHTAREAAQREAELRARRYAGLAAELAADLTRDDPCPVCGSREHPSPAEPGADPVSLEDVEAAEEARRAADHAVGTAQSQQDVLRQRRADQVDLAGGQDTAAAREEWEAAKTQLDTIEKRRKEAATLEAQLRTHDENTAQLAQQITDMEVERTAEATAIAEQHTQLDTDRARITEARGAEESIAARHRHLEQRAGTASVLRESLNDLIAAQTRLEDSAREVTEARTAAAHDLETELASMETVGLPTTAPASRAESTQSTAVTEGSITSTVPATELPEDDNALRAVLLPAQRRRDLHNLSQQHRDAQRRWHDGMDEAHIAETDGTAEALAAATTALHSATEAHTAAATRLEDDAGRRATAEAIHRGTLSAAQALRDTADAAHDVQERAGAVVRVADLATGTSSDGERIRLSTFVLMRRFEDVIDAANARLASFDRSELELVRDTGARGARRTGLDLQVIDRRTDQQRVPETLSGGETFFVSLALALGLADIVTAEAGGVQMETLFIDEGFGSLDPESFEKVVSEIGRLAAHGRTIGVVSHVGDMKTQIAEQIHVRRTPEGPSRATITA